MKICIPRLKKSLSNRISIYFLIVVIIPVTILGLYATKQSQVQIANEKKTRYEESLANKVNSINRWIHSFEYSADYLKVNKDLERYLNNNDLDKYSKWYNLTNNIVPALHIMSITSDQIDTLRIYTGNEVQEHGQWIYHLEELKNKDYYSQLIEGQEAFWAVDKQLITYFHSLKTPFSNSVTNYVAFSCRLSVFNELLSEDKIEEGNILLVDDKSNILYTSDDTLDETFSIGAKEQYKVYSKTIDKTGWELYYIVDHKIFNQGNASILIVAILLMLFSFCLITILIRSISNKIVAPINELVTRMKEVEKGNFKVYIKAPYEDEIGVLTQQFNRMTHRINKLIEEVYESKLEMKEAELSALQAKINPHFLYNSLGVVSWIAILNEQDEISKVLESLVIFYKSILNKGTPFTTVRQELDNIKAYLDIMLIVKDQGFTVNYSIESSVLDCECLNVTLQPIVENAIEHGIKDFMGKGASIDLSIFQKDNSVIMQVRDNGAGMDAQTSDLLLVKESTGYGVKNVFERNKLYYGEQFEMGIESRIEEGTTITIKIPFHEEEETK